MFKKKSKRKGGDKSHMKATATATATAANTANDRLNLSRADAGTALTNVATPGMFNASGFTLSSAAPAAASKVDADRSSPTTTEAPPPSVVSEADLANAKAAVMSAALAMGNPTNTAAAGPRSTVRTERGLGWST